MVETLRPPHTFTPSSAPGPSEQQTPLLLSRRLSSLDLESSCRVGVTHMLHDVQCKKNEGGGKTFKSKQVFHFSKACCHAVVYKSTSALLFPAGQHAALSWSPCPPLLPLPPLLCLFVLKGVLLSLMADICRKKLPGNNMGGCTTPDCSPRSHFMC